MRKANRSDVDALRDEIERQMAAAHPGLDAEVFVASSARSCATVRVLANSEDQETVIWVQLYIRDPSVPDGVVRRLLDLFRESPEEDRDG